MNGIDPSGLFTIAEVSAARSIRNTLAEAQFTSYSDLIRNTDSDGTGGKIARFIDIATGVVTIAEILQASPIILGMVLSSKQGQSIAKIIRKFKNFECVNCARDIKRFMKSNEIPGKHIRISTGSNRGPDAGIWDDSLNLQISNNGIHEAVVIDIDGIEMVFDNHRPIPIPKDEWLENMTFSSKEYGYKGGFDEIIIEEF